MSKTKVLVILGMHRSGTSLMANWLSACNINMGDKLLEGNSSNPKGHYEDVDFHDLHEEILRYNDVPYGGLISLPKTLKINSYLEAKIKYNLLLKSYLRSQWGWKEPRTCLFLDLYRKFIPEAYYLVLYRDCTSVVESLIRREIKLTKKKYRSSRLGLVKSILFNKGKSIEKASKEKSIHYENAWVRYNQGILFHLEKVDKSNYIVLNVNELVDYESIIMEKLQDWKFNINHIPFSRVFDKKIRPKKNKIHQTTEINDNIMGVFESLRVKL